jgi:transforming growth factor-beta-induced protein
MPVRCRTLALFGALTVLLLSLSTAPVAAQDAEAESIATVATEDGRFTTLVAALGIAGLTDTFADCESGTEYTVLAPTDDAFDTALAALGLDATALVADLDLVTSVLQHHVIEGAVASEQVSGLDGESVTMLSGEEVTVSVEDAVISVGSANPTAATVIVADVQACNGIIHAIDNVLIPPSAAETLGLTAAEPATDDAGQEPEATTTSDELAATGASSEWTAMVGVILVGLGAGAVMVSRRLRYTR